MEEGTIISIQKPRDRWFSPVFEQPESKSRIFDEMQIPKSKPKLMEYLRIC